MGAPPMAETEFLNSSPPWVVLSLVSHYLDPKTLIIASCVCQSWSECVSSNHLWQPICAALYPSLSHLHAAANPAVSYRRLFTLGCTAQRRRLQKPIKPQLSLHDIIFAIDIYNNNSCLCTAVKSGDELCADDNLLFRFDIDYNTDIPLFVEEIDDLRVTWNVVLKGFRSVFTMMDCKGKGNVVLGLEGWFSKELPPSGCCSGVCSANGLAADLRLGLKILKETGGGISMKRRVIVEKMSVGVMNIVSWRYAAIDDTLRYLQNFLVTR